MRARTPQLTRLPDLPAPATPAPVPPEPDASSLPAQVKKEERPSGASTLKAAAAAVPCLPAPAESDRQLASEIEEPLPATHREHAKYPNATPFRDAFYKNDSEDIYTNEDGTIYCD